MRRHVLPLTAAAVLALTMSACSADAPAPAGSSSSSPAMKAESPSSAAAPASAASSSTAAATSSAAASSSEPAATESSAAADDGMLTFGETHTWPNGLAITIDKPAKFKPTTSAAGAEGTGAPMKYKVTLKNGSKEPVSAGMIGMQSSSGSAEDAMIVDSEGDVMPPSVDIQPGKSLSWNTAYMVNEPADQTIDVTNMTDFTSEKVYFKAG